MKRKQLKKMAIRQVGRIAYKKTVGENAEMSEWRLRKICAELAVFGLVSGLFSKKIYENGLWAFPAVIAAQLAGRAVFLGLVAVCQSFAPFTVPMIRSQILAGWPGLAIQAVAVPLLVIALRALLIKEK